MSSAGTFTTEGHSNALPPGTRLGEFEIRRVIGVGGFGIVYLAFDHGLEREVAIKEYMPSSLAARTATLHVSLTSPNNEETFKLGLRSFVNEAKLLARFDHRSLIKVHRFWEERGTAYMVMPLLRGRTLREARRVLGPPDEAWLRGVLDPVLGALEVLHREDVFHRDIAPDNILIGEDSVPMLLDFGAARHVIQGRSQTLTAILKPSYAPIEQYGEATNLRQGAWTDLYALGATFHFLITESPPLPATVRTVSDDAAPLASVARPGISERFLRTVDWMLAPRPADRPQSVQDLREVLSGRIEVPVRVVLPPSPTAWQRTEVQPERGADIPLGLDELPQNAVPVSVPPSVPPSVLPAPPVPVRAAPPVTPAPLPMETEEWSATADRVLPPQPGGLPKRPMLPMLAVGGGVVLAGAALLWVLQRPAPAPAPVPVAHEPAASAPLAASAAAPVVLAASAATVDTSAASAAASAVAQSPVAAPAASVAVAPTPVAPSAPVRVAAPVRTAPAPAPAAMTVDNAALRPLPSSATEAGGGQRRAATAANSRNATAAAGPAVTNPPPERRPPVLPGPGTDGAPYPRQNVPVETPAAARAGNDGALTPMPASRNADPRENCGGRMLLALHKCLVRECAKPQYYDHAECVQVRAIEERARARVGGG
ncbi:protein kinase domain-containing protein [Aquabacterium sp.]|uniref:serine/threonine protein kinase n=1 Tax=Aquabacterium sp. TaxID=1872578 RepID=UPI0037849AE9